MIYDLQRKKKLIEHNSKTTMVQCMSKRMQTVEVNSSEDSGFSNYQKRIIKKIINENRKIREKRKKSLQSII